MNRARRFLPHLVFAGLAIVVAVGLILDARGTRLYVPNPPFLWGLDPQVDPWVIVAVVALAASVLAAPRLLRLGPAAFGVALLVLSLVVRLPLSAAREGTSRWDGVFDPTRSFEAGNEYIPALPALRYGTHIFLDRFAEIVPALPVHAAGHGPGLLLVMHAFGIDSAAPLAALVIAAGALATPVLYLIARRALDEPAARVAGLLLAFSPGVAMLGVSSADALYMLLGSLAALGLVAGPRGRVAGAAVLAVSSLFAWSLLAVGAWAAVMEWTRAGLRRALALGVMCGVALVVFYAVLHGATGFDPLGTLRGTEQVYRLGIAQGRPYWFWLFGSPTAFLVAVGLPITWLALRGLAEGRREAIAIFAVIAVASVLGFTKAETERIWLFFVPFLCLAAAAALPRHRLRLVLGLLAAQGLVFELLFDSVW